MNAVGKRVQYWGVLGESHEREKEREKGMERKIAKNAGEERMRFSCERENVVCVCVHAGLSTEEARKMRMKVC